MALILTIGVVVVLVIVRLFLPPVPGLLKSSVDRFGKRGTIMLCVVALAGAALLVLLTRR
jgi:hypothetical protein